MQVSERDGTILPERCSKLPKSSYSASLKRIITDLKGICSAEIPVAVTHVVIPDVIPADLRTLFVNLTHG